MGPASRFPHCTGIENNTVQRGEISGGVSFSPEQTFAADCRAEDSGTPRPTARSQPIESRKIK